METISNLVNAVGNALQLFTSSVTFVVEMVGYIPAIIGSAVIVFLSAYIIRFALLK